MTKLWGVGPNRQGTWGRRGARTAAGGALIACVLSLAACGGSKPPPAEPSPEPAADSDMPPGAGTDVSEGADTDTAGGDSAPSNAPSDAAAPAPASGAAAGEGGGAAPATGGAAETRTTEAISEVVNKNRPKVRACYEAVQKKLPDLAGDLTLKFTLDAEGKVKSIEQDLDKSTLKNPDVAKCAMDEIKTWQFPPSSRGMDTTVNYPFNFKPKK